MLAVIDASKLSQDRVNICNALIEAIHADNFNVVIISPDSISFTPRSQIFKNGVIPDRHELENQAYFLLSLAPESLVIQMHRATSIRDLAIFCYEDPLLFEKLASVLSKVDICLEL